MSHQVAKAIVLTSDKLFRFLSFMDIVYDPSKSPLSSAEFEGKEITFTIFLSRFCLFGKFL